MSKFVVTTESGARIALEAKTAEQARKAVPAAESVKQMDMRKQQDRDIYFNLEQYPYGH